MLAAFDVPPGETIELNVAQRAAIESLADHRAASRRWKRVQDEQDVLSQALLSKDKARTTILYSDILDSVVLLSKAYPANFHRWLQRCASGWSEAVERNGGVVFHRHGDNLAAYFRDLDGDGAASSEISGQVYRRLSNEMRVKLISLPQGVMLVDNNRFAEPLLARFPLPPCVPGDRFED